jgi:hypothetical protein
VCAIPPACGPGARSRPVAGSQIKQTGVWFWVGAGWQGGDLPLCGRWGPPAAPPPPRWAGAHSRATVCNESTAAMNRWKVRTVSLEDACRHCVKSMTLMGFSIPTRACSDPSREGWAALNVRSYVYSNDEWLRSLCEEYVLIVHLDESSKSGLYVGCQQCERYRIKGPAKDGPLYISVPFDKVDRVGKRSLRQWLQVPCVEAL